MKTFVWLLAGFALAYYVLEHGQRIAASRIAAGPISPSTQPIAPYQVGSVPGGGGGGGSGINAEGVAVQGTQAGLQVAQTFAQSGTAVASAIPIVGAFVSIGATIAGIFTASHAAAVRTEAGVLNASVPAFFKSCDAIMAGLDQGSLTPDQAKQLIDQAVSAYYAGVSGSGSGHIEKGGPCNIDTTKADLGRSTMVYPPHCNGPCVQGCGNIETTAAGLKRLIDAGGGTFTTMNGIGTGPHAGFAGYPPTTYTYNPVNSSLRTWLNI